MRIENLIKERKQKIINYLDNVKSNEITGFENDKVLISEKLLNDNLFTDFEETQIVDSGVESHIELRDFKQTAVKMTQMAVAVYKFKTKGYNSILETITKNTNGYSISFDSKTKIITIELWTNFFNIKLSDKVKIEVNEKIKSIVSKENANIDSKINLVKEYNNNLSEFVDSKINEVILKLKEENDNNNSINPFD